MKYKQIKDLTVGKDLVCGTDGKFYDVIDKTPIHLPEKVYEFHTTNGKSVCSGSHLWTLWNNSIRTILQTEDIYNLTVLNDSDFRISDFTVGTSDGPSLIKVVPCKYSVECLCITTNAPDHQFVILTDTGQEILTHNCQQRFVCGPVNAIASRMALGDSSAMFIDPDDKGAGIANYAGKKENVKYYYITNDWTNTWFKDRGLDEKGYDPNPYNGGDSNGDEIDLGDDLEEITIEKEQTTIEFSGEKSIIDNTLNQKFDEI